MITKQKKRITLEYLAGMMKRGFDESQENTDRQIGEVKVELREFKLRIDGLADGQQRIERKMDNKVDYWKLDDHEKRIVALEKKSLKA